MQIHNPGISIGYSTNTSGFSGYNTHAHTITYIYITPTKYTLTVKQTLIEAKIYSQADTFADHRLQRSKHGSNSARSSEQQGMQALG